MKNTVKGIIALILALVLGAGVCCMGYASRDDSGKWFGNFKNLSKWHWADPKPEEGNGDENTGAIIVDGESNGIKLASTRIAVEDYEGYGISAQAESAFEIVAAIEPATATIQEVDYSIAWENAASDWATGKDVNDYYSISQPSDGSLTATATCLQAFAEPVIITCALRDDFTPLTATVRAEYVAKFMGLTIETPFYFVVGENQELSVNYNAEWSIGTITNGTVSFNSFTVEFSQRLNQSIRTRIDNFYKNNTHLIAASPMQATKQKVYSVSVENNTVKTTADWSDILTFEKAQTVIDDPDTYLEEYNAAVIELRDTLYNALYRAWGNGTTDNMISLTIDYSYTIDGITNSSTETANGGLDTTQCSVSPTNLTLSESILKH